MNSVTTPAPVSDREIRFNCPHCSAAYRVSQKHLGRRTTCSNCNRLVTITTPESRVVPKTCPLGVKPSGAKACPPIPNKRVAKAPPRCPDELPVTKDTVETWQLVVGVILCAIPPFLFALWSLLGAVTLRAAYSWCIDRDREPTLARAWWVSLTVSALSLPITILNLVLSAAFPEIALPIGIVALVAAACTFGGLYKEMLKVSFGQGMLLWLMQLLMILPLYIAAITFAFVLT